MQQGVSVTLETWQLVIGLIVIGATTASVFFKGINNLSDKFCLELENINQTMRQVSNDLIRVEENKVGFPELREHCRDKMESCPCGIHVKELERRLAELSSGTQRS